MGSSRVHVWVICTKKKQKQTNTGIGLQVKTETWCEFQLKSDSEMISDLPAQQSNTASTLHVSFY